ncbi:ABC transporter substrate-binding protein [Gemmatimonadetes bacterium T265]|nr:ABC transporter substrate-binding protein [Gemmatimonadetes bacterium T265]
MFSPQATRLRRAARLALGACVLAATRCGDRRAAAAPAAGRPAAITVTDDGGRPVHLAGPARRVVCLIPSATETLVALGAADRLVGRTRYDVAPEVAALPSVGGGLDPSVEAIVALRPDLVLGWENDRRGEVREKLASLGIPVFSLRTEDTVDVFRNLAAIGRLAGRDSAAAAVAASIHHDFDAVRRSVAGRPRPRVFYVVSNDPPMTAGPQTFVAQLVGLAGGQSIFPDVRQSWPTVSMEEIVRRAPDLVVVPRGERSRNEVPGTALAELRARGGWRDVGAVRAGHVVTVDENLVNRPGPHVGEAARALRAVLHPELAAAAAGR